MYPPCSRKARVFSDGVRGMVTKQTLVPIRQHTEMVVLRDIQLHNHDKPSKINWIEQKEEELKPDAGVELGKGSVEFLS